MYSPRAFGPWKDGVVIDTELEIIIAAPPEAVWTLISDPVRLPQWLAFCEKVDVLDPGTVGMKLRLSDRIRGKLGSETDVEVTAFSPPRELAWRVVEERVEGKRVRRFARETRFHIRLEPREGDTKVRLRSEQDPRSAFHGLLIRALARRRGQRLIARSLQRLQLLATVR